MGLELLDPFVARVFRMLRFRREALGWTQRDLADEVGIAQQSVTRLEVGGIGDPRLMTLVRMAHGLRCGLEVRLVPKEAELVEVELDPLLRPAVDELARKLGISPSLVVARAVWEYCGRRGINLPAIEPAQALSLDQGSTGKSGARPAGES